MNIKSDVTHKAVNHNKTPKCSYKTEMRLGLKQQIHITLEYSTMDRHSHTQRRKVSI